MDITLTKDQIHQAAQQAYGYASNVTGGDNANYIPYLANIDPGLFGLSVMLPDGTAFNYGHILSVRHRIGVESAYRNPRHETEFAGGSARKDRCRRHRSAFQLHLRHIA